jgi:phage FluMu protein gp41
MARIKGQLRHGLKMGKEFLKDFELHDHLTAGMIIEAKESAEKVVPFEVGGRMVPVVVESPAKLGALILCQQVASIGHLAGPLDYGLFATLHQDDLDILNLYADLAAGAITSKQVSDKMAELAAQASPEVTQRGRDVGPCGDTGSSGAKADGQGCETD